MSEEILRVRFGVLGGGSISGESGQDIVKDLTSIVTAINSGDGLPKIKIKLDQQDFQRQYQDLKKQLQELNININPGADVTSSLVTELQKISTLVDEIKNKNFNVNNVFEYKASSKADATDRLELLRQKALELINIGKQYRDIATDPKFAGAFYQGANAQGKVSEYITRLQKFDSDLMTEKANSVTNNGDAMKLSAELQSFVNIMESIRSSANQKLGDIIPKVDDSGLVKINQELDDMQQKNNRIKEAFLSGGIGANATNGATSNVQSQSSTIGDLNPDNLKGAFDTIEQMIQQIREKLVECFNLSTIDLHESEIESKIKPLIQSAQQIKQVANNSVSPDSQNVDKNFTYILNRYKSLSKEMNAINLRRGSLEGVNTMDKFGFEPQDITARQNTLNELTQALSRFTSEEQKAKIEAANLEIALANEKDVNTAENQLSRLSEKIRQYYRTNKSAMAQNKGTFKQYQDLMLDVQNGTVKNLEEFTKRFQKLTMDNQKQGGDVKTFFTRIKESIVTNISTMAATFVSQTMRRAFRGIYQNVLKIDTALTQLKIVTQESSNSMARFASNISNTAKKIGVSINELTDSVTTYARLGYSLDQSSLLAELTSQYSKVSGVAVNEATTNITAIVKAFDVNVDELEGVLDRLVYVGNNFPISSAQIGEGMNYAASALKAGGNSLDESIALLVGANTTVQNISTASTALRTIAARLSASKEELSDLGEDNTGVETVAKLNDQLKLLGINIMNESGELRTTYDILSQMANKWEKMSTTERATLATLSAGTRQQNVFQSLMQNWDEVSKTVETMGDSNSALATANEARLDSIQGKLDQIKSTFESISQNVLPEDVVKSVLDIVLIITKGLDLIFKAFDAIGGIKTILTTSIVPLTTLIINKIVVAKLVPLFVKLKEGVKGIGAATRGINASLMTTQGMISAITAGAFILVSAISLISAGVNNAINKNLEKIKETTNEINAQVESYKALQQNIVEYANIVNSINGDNFNQTQLEKIKDIQESLVDLAKQYRQEIDLTGNNYQQNFDKLKNLSDLQRQSLLEEYTINQKRLQYTYDTKLFWSGTQSGTISRQYAEDIELTSDNGIRLNYDNLEDFIKQYENISKTYKSVMNRDDISDSLRKSLSNQLSHVLDNYKDLYDEYKNNQSVIDTLNDIEKKAIEDSKIKNLELNNELQKIKKAYDVFDKAAKDMNNYGKLQSDTINSVFGEGLENYFIEVTDGYKMINGALDQYIQKLEEVRVNEVRNSKSEEELQIALENYATWLAISATLKLKDAEAQEKILEEQSKAYKELLDLRKKLLSSFKEELNYQKELSKKSKDLSRLKTELAIAQLDNSESGKSKARELSSELSNLQDEFDDFTLEHAIQVVTEEIDNEYSQYEDFIKKQIQNIKDSIDNLTGVVEKIGDKFVLDGDEYVYGSDMFGNTGYHRNLQESGQIKLSTSFTPESTRDIAEYNGERYIKDSATGNIYKLSDLIYNRNGNFWSVPVGTTYYKYHTGGFVGGLQSNEEFAKLMKGEFVVTPNMMSKFMNNTLPSLTHGNTFNSPLITIECGTVSSESLPGLKKIVNEAVNEIQKQMNSGFSRTGYKQSIKQSLY